MLYQITKTWIRAGEHTLSGTLNYIPAIAITWLVAGVAGGEVPVAPQVAQTGLSIICLSFYFAAAARTRGLTGESTFWFGLSRPGAEAEPFIIALKMLIIAVIGFVTGMLIAEEHGARIGLACAALVCLLILSRAWPVFAVPFFYKGKYRWSGSAHGIIWSGPGLRLARRISRQPLAIRTATPAFMIALLILLLPLIVAQIYFGPSFWLNFFFYAVALPYLSMLNLNLTALLLAEHEHLKKAANDR